MKLTDITTPITSISGVGESTAKNFARLNIFTVADLLQHYPREWEDRTKIIPLALHGTVKKIHTLAQVVEHSFFGFGRMRTLKIIIDDGTQRASLLCFNRPFLEKSYPVGSIISVTGSFSIKYGELQSSSFEGELIASSGNLQDYKDITLPDAKVFPIYPLTAGITQVQMRKVIGKALKSFAKGIENELPENVIDKYSLMNKTKAICKIHQPETMEEAEKARYSIIFEELYNFQEAIIQRYIQRNNKLPQDFSINAVTSGINSTNNTEDAISSSLNKEDENISSTDFAAKLSPKQKQLFARLPFNLTQDQMAAILEINEDIDNPYMKDGKTESPMARLLQGDVGSGKTLVAFFACLRQIDYGGQCAILAPTELLAHQHANNAASMLQAATGVRLAFLTGNIKTAGRTQLLKELKNGSIDIVIGTHALFSQNVVYKNLRLVIIDEQHRFGVVQRNAIIEKGRQSILEQKDPSLLMMSATPIPRTLALTVFGDLDISNIRTMPQGRLPIQTHLTRRGNEAKAYEAVRQQLKNGHQAYFVYPLIEQGETDSNLKSAEEMFKFLSTQVYPEYKCALVHSQIDDISQQEILTAFKNGTIDILVATSVVEVGVDVPNATSMVIEHAERFGLAALHQLRGRVGRGQSQSHCFLIYSNNLSESGKARLKALYESTDGFYIAEQDMILRGPGEVSGIQQSGYLTLGLADPVRDNGILLLTRKAVLDQLKAKNSLT